MKILLLMLLVILSCRLDAEVVSLGNIAIIILAELLLPFETRGVFILLSRFR